jgi:hypothetical protein
MAFPFITGAAGPVIIFNYFSIFASSFYSYATACTFTLSFLFKISMMGLGDT